jgi:hypothetical protein
MVCAAVSLPFVSECLDHLGRVKATSVVPKRHFDLAHASHCAFPSLSHQARGSEPCTRQTPPMPLQSARTAHCPVRRKCLRLGLMSCNVRGSEPPSPDTPSSIWEIRPCFWLKLAGLQLQIMPINYSSVVVPPTSRSGYHAREWCTRVPMVPRP